jgi:hypothetical protein
MINVPSMTALKRRLAMINVPSMTALKRRLDY